MFAQNSQAKELNSTKKADRRKAKIKYSTSTSSNILCRENWRENNAAPQGKKVQQKLRKQIYKSDNCYIILPKMNSKKYAIQYVLWKSLTGFF